MKTTALKITLLFLLSTCLFVSCSKNNEDEQAITLAGSKWTKSYQTYLDVLEFSSKKDVQYYVADKNGNFQSDMSNGTYKIDGSKIVFTNLKDKLIDATITEGNISGNSIILKMYWTSVDGKEIERTETLNRIQ